MNDPSSTSSNKDLWPELPYAKWQPTLDTLHLWTQIVGKTRLALAPMEDHWWQVALYAPPRGLTTPAMPYGNRTIAVEFDFLDHNLYATDSEGERRTVGLAPRSVADFHREYLGALRSLGVEPRIRSVPVEVEIAVPFAEDRVHASYDADVAQRWWRLLVQADR